MTAATLVEHFFRHEYGKLVAALVRRVGVQYVHEVEDAVQSALMKALESWTYGEQPENPSAWLFRVAHNELLGQLRKQTRQLQLLREVLPQGLEDESPQASLADEERDDLLSMLFVCCDESVPPESQLVFALKTLCGFDIREIALRLFISEENAYKRLGRARNQLRDRTVPAVSLNDERFASRLGAVTNVLYLMFTEGHLSSNPDAAIRKELTEDAIRLTEVLVRHPVGQVPEVYALLALMHLHAARTGARRDPTGGLLLLEEQDRSLWDAQRIGVGLSWLAKSAQGRSFSRFHAEAGIAAEHCLAPSFAETRWEKIVECYDLLERATPSAIHRLNRAVAVAEWRGPDAGLAALEGVEPPTWLLGSYLWTAVLADLHRRAGNGEIARQYREAALASAPTPDIRVLLERRLGTGLQA